MSRIPRPIPPGALDQAVRELSAPPLVPRATDAPDPHACDRQQLRNIAWWKNANLVCGLLLCTFGYIFLAATHEEMVKSEQAVARMVGREPKPVYDPAPGTFWLGVALIAISQLQAIQVAIRETHMADR